MWTAAWEERIVTRGWITALAPMEIGCVPERVAVVARSAVGWMVRGGFLMVVEVADDIVCQLSNGILWETG